MPYYPKYQKGYFGSLSYLDNENKIVAYYAEYKALSKSIECFTNNFMNDTFECLSCGRKNPKRGGCYTNTYCNNQCQQNHRRLMLKQKRISEWLSGCGTYVWKEVPDYAKDYLIEQRGHLCETCGNSSWMNTRIPLMATQKDGNTYDNREDNLELICPNCMAQK